MGCSGHSRRLRRPGRRESPGYQFRRPVLEFAGLLTPESQSCHSLNCFSSSTGLKLPKVASHASRLTPSMATRCELNVSDSSGIDAYQHNKVFTSSYDGTLRSTSFVTGVSTELLATEDHLLSSFDLSQNGREIWISDSGGGLQHLDIREPSQSRRWQLTEKEKIGCVSVNPVVPHLLLSASNNRTLRMWDSRYLQKIDLSTEDDKSDIKSAGDDDQVLESTWQDVQHYLDTDNGPKCLWGEWAHRQSVSSAFWDPSGRKVVSTSYDDTLRGMWFRTCSKASSSYFLVWDIRSNALKSNGPLGSFRPLREIKHNCQTVGYLPPISGF